MEEDIISQRKCHVYTSMTKWKCFPIVQNEPNFFFKATLPSSLESPGLRKPNSTMSLSTLHPVLALQSTHLPSHFYRTNSNPPRCWKSIAIPYDYWWPEDVSERRTELFPENLACCCVRAGLGESWWLSLLSALRAFSTMRMCPASSALEVFKISLRYICCASSQLVHYL